MDEVRQNAWDFLFAYRSFFRWTRHMDELWTWMICDTIKFNHRHFLMINTVSDMVELLELLKTKGVIPPPDKNKKKKPQKTSKTKTNIYIILRLIMTFLFYFI